MSKVVKVCDSYFFFNSKTLRDVFLKCKKKLETSNPSENEHTSNAQKQRIIILRHWKIYRLEKKILNNGIPRS